MTVLKCPIVCFYYNNKLYLTQNNFLIWQTILYRVLDVSTQYNILYHTKKYIVFNSLSANRSGGRKTLSYVLNFYVGIAHNILREMKTWRAKIYLPTQRTNRPISYDIN